MDSALTPLANLTTCSRYELLVSLCRTLGPAEREALRTDDPSLVISAFNRETLLRMLQMEGGMLTGDGPVDPTSVRSCVAALDGFLQEQMPARPEGHKWIVLASLYLAFVAHRPLHPIDRAGVVVEQLDGRTIYRCPLKVPGDNPICDACVCLEK